MSHLMANKDCSYIYNGVKIKSLKVFLK